MKSLATEFLFFNYVIFDIKETVLIQLFKYLFLEFKLVQCTIFNNELVLKWNSVETNITSDE